MAMPKSVTKINKNGVMYVSNVNAIEYTITELARGALRDVGKLVRREAKAKVPKDTRNLEKNIATWVKKDLKGGLPTLQIGIYDRARARKKGLKYAFYGSFFEFGTSKQKAKPFIKPAVLENINKIRDIESKYLSGIDKVKLGDKFDENEEIKDD